MIDVVSEFFGITGLDMYPPENMAELIPYLVQVAVALVLVVSVFKLIAGIVRIMCDWRLFR